MRIERPRIQRKVCLFKLDTGLTRETCPKASLDCGHQRMLDFIDGKVIDVAGGVYQDGKWTDWEGREVAIGDRVECHECSRAAYLKALDARPPEPAQRYATREECDTAHPNAKWHETGPIHKHGDKFYVKVYLGQHEWLAFNVDDVREVWGDPGWEGTEHGWAFVPEWNAEYAVNFLGTRGEIEAPERPGKPITGDEMLFSERGKLREYLGPDDPLRAELKLDKEP